MSPRELVQGSHSNVCPFLSRADLWPSVLRLIPAPERHVHAKILMEWIKRHDPPICKVVAYGADIDKAHNESSFKSLITLLQEKGMVCIVPSPKTQAYPLRLVLVRHLLLETPAGTSERCHISHRQYLSGCCDLPRNRRS